MLGLREKQMTQFSRLLLASPNPEVIQHGGGLLVKGLRDTATKPLDGASQKINDGKPPPPRHEMEISRPPNQSIKTKIHQHVISVNRVIWAFREHGHSVRIIMSSTTDLNFFCHGEYD
jgi:hypothetical protein